MHYYEVKYRRPDRMDLHTEWSAFRTREEAREHLERLRDLYFIAHMRPISRTRYDQRVGSI